MRIKGPGDGPKPPDAVDEANAVDGATEATTAAPSAVDKTSPTGKADPVADVAARLRAGEITTDQAVDLLIEDAIERQLGGVGKDLAPKLREVLRDYADQDPYLAAKIRRLTQGR
jgi:hypothetical protein